MRIKTKYGTAYVNHHGYLQIISKEEGNYSKTVHRLVFLDYYGSIPAGSHIHHRDGNKLNNNIDNLQLLSQSEHRRLHTKGKNNPMYGKKHSKKSINKMIASKLGKKQSIAHKISSSASKSSTGFFRVSIEKNPKLKQGFTWVYQYFEGETRKKLSSVDIDKLKQKVLAKGLVWKEFEKIKEDNLC